MHDIAIILPAFNEELTIGDTIEDFYNELPNSHFVVIDNGSTDGTNLAARSAISRLGLSGEVFLELRRGKAMAVRTAFSLVDAQISNTSVNRKIASLKSYYKFLLKTKQIVISPLLKHK